MAASSVTGVGHGSALKKQKGSENMSLGAEKIIGPRIVYAAIHTLDSSGDLVVKLPKLQGSDDDYVVSVTHNDVTTPAAIAAKVEIENTETVVTIKGGASDKVSVVIINAGLAI